MTTKTIVIDHGSGFVKAGLAGCNKPQMVLSNIVNYTPCQENPGPSYARRQVSLGIDFSHPDTFSYPTERGHVLNWEGVEHIWSFIMNEYREEHEDCPVLITESPFWEPTDRKKTLEIMFEYLHVPTLLLADQLNMSLYSSGHLTGMVVDSGYGLTQVKCFHQGYPVHSSCQMLEFAGQDLSAYLCKSLFKDDADPRNLFQMETVNHTQKRKCYVPNNLAEVLFQCTPSSSDKDLMYQLPDGTMMELTPMEQIAPEMFFSPQVFNLPGPSIPQLLLESLKTCDSSLHPMLMSHVVVCGGNTMYPGFSDRLYNELATSDLLSSTNASLWVGSDRNFSVWLGASVVAQLSSFKSQWVTREQYEEDGKV
ncbi:actin-like protein 8 [Tenrec ecaudatus]|uniref:actin-like protein 8 n=1 Tax=Tenrec ecaudatus TaxID=94439 RepID=UPI003F5A99B6